MLQSEFNALNILNNIGPDTTTPTETPEAEQTETEDQVEE